MALPLANTFESGQTDGTTITTGNSGAPAGDAFDSVTIDGSGGTVQFKSDQKMHGLLAGRFQVTANAQFDNVRWSTSMGSVTDIYGRAYVYLPALPPSGFRHHPVDISLAGTGSCASFAVLDTGAVRTFDSVGTVATSTATLSTATWYRFEWHVTMSATTGLVEVKLFSGDSSSVIETLSSSNRNTNASANQVIFGCTTGFEGGAFTSYLDDIQVNGTGYPGPSGSTSQFLRPSADSSDGAWTNQAGTGVNLFDSIDETSANDTDYIQSELAPTSSGVRLKLSTGSTPGAGTRYFRWRVGKDQTGGGTVNMTARIREDATASNVLGTGTLVQEFTRNGVDAATTFEETITGSVTNYANLYVEFLATQA